MEDVDLLLDAAEATLVVMQRTTTLIAHTGPWADADAGREGVRADRRVHGARSTAPRSSITSETAHIPSQSQIWLA